MNEYKLSRWARAHAGEQKMPRMSRTDVTLTCFIIVISSNSSSSRSVVMLAEVWSEPRQDVAVYRRRTSYIVLRRAETSRSNGVDLTGLLGGHKGRLGVWGTKSPPEAEAFL